MLHYPLATLMLAGIRRIAIVVDPDSEPAFRRLLGDGSKLGVELIFVRQDEPLGIADGLREAIKSTGDVPVLVILGDNFFFGPSVGESLREVVNSATKSKVFVKSVMNPRPFGVVELRDGASVEKVVEKPTNPSSQLVATGLYHFRRGDLNDLSSLVTSARGEVEIAELLNKLSGSDALEAIMLPRSTFWTDLGTFESINATENLIQAVETTQVASVLSPEIIAFSNGWISRDSCLDLLDAFPAGPKKDLLLFETRYVEALL